MYKKEVKRSRKDVHAHFGQDGVFVPPTPNGVIAPATNHITVHYSFDFAQQVHYPSNPLLPGPIYFLTPRKAAIFGICCEAIPRQVNFIVDEASHTGKGANTVVSLLDYFFEHYGLGETTVSLHADNCSGQNKNNTTVQYLMWRVLTGLHNTVNLHFMITGHTKFSPDACFGLVKSKFRKTPVSSLDDLARVVDDSAACNVCQLVGAQDGLCLYRHEIGPGSSPPTSAAWMVSSSTITFTLSETIEGQSSFVRLLWQKRRKGNCCGLHGDHP